MLKDDELQSNAALLKQCRQTFDRWEAFASSRSGTSAMFLWAAAEATVWPIIPDFLLVPMSVGNRRRFVVPLAAAVAGMAVGGTATYLFVYWWPQHALDLLHHVPLTGNREIEAVGRRLTKEGVGAYWLQPWSGISYKVWGVVGGIRKLNPLLVIPTFILARAIRMALFSVAAGLIARRFTLFIRDFFLYLAVLYVIFFAYGLWQVVRLS